MATGKEVRKVPPPPWEMQSASGQPTAAQARMPEAANVPPPPRAAGQPGETSTITGAQKPAVDEGFEKGKRVAAGVTRFGPPVAAAFTGLGLPAIGLQALVAGGSEFSARQIENLGKDPELETLYEDMKAGGFVGALDAGFNIVFKGLGAGVRKIAGKIALPKEIPADIAIAQETLGKMRNPDLTRWQRFIGKARPFSLTFGQINAEERNFVSWLEGVARSGLAGRGRIRQFDLRNEQAVHKLFDDYVAQRMTQMTDPEIGVFVKRILGPSQDATGAALPYGESFRPVESLRKYLYKQFDEGLERVTLPVDGTQLRQYIRSGNDDFVNKIYNGLRSEGLLPPLTGAQDVTRRTRTTTRVSEQVDQASDFTRASGPAPDELGEPVRRAAEETGERTSRGVQEKFTRREVLEDSAKLTEAQIAEAWRNLAPADVDKIIRGINAGWSNGPDARVNNNMLAKMRDQIEPDFVRVIRSEPGLEDTWLTAKRYKTMEADAFENTVLKKVRTKLTETPSAVASMFDGLTGDPATTYDQLRRIKSTLYFSASAAPSPGAPGGGMGREAIEATWEKSILRPLRYRFINDSTIDGVLDPTRLMNKIKNIENTTPELLVELFGGQRQVQELKNLAISLDVIQRQATERNIFIQLKQAGVLGRVVGGHATMGAAGAAGGAALSDNPKTGALAGGGTAIILGPYALSRMLTNPRLVRSLTDGIEAGPHSHKLSTALRKIGTMNYASDFAREHPSPEAVEYYTTLQEVNPEQAK